MIGVWRWFESIFASEAPATISGRYSLSQNELSPAAVGKLAIDTAARNALLEVHFGELKIERRAARRFARPPRPLNR